MKSVQERLFESAMLAEGIWLGVAPLQELLSVPCIDAWITDRAERENDKEPGTLQAGLLGNNFYQQRTWEGFKQQVASTRRPPMVLKHVVPDGVAGSPGVTSITVTPEMCGLVIQPEGTGVAEMENCGPVYVEFYEGLPRVVIWPHINDGDDVQIVDLSGTLEACRNPDPVSDLPTEPQPIL